jgi:hypothetical protein
MSPYKEDGYIPYNTAEHMKAIEKLIAKPIFFPSVRRYKNFSFDKGGPLSDWMPQCNHDGDDFTEIHHDELESIFEEYQGVIPEGKIYDYIRLLSEDAFDIDYYINIENYPSEAEQFAYLDTCLELFYYTEPYHSQLGGRL